MGRRHAGGHSVLPVRALLTLHGTLDTLLPIRADSDVYARKVAAAGAGALHRAVAPGSARTVRVRVSR